MIAIVKGQTIHYTVFGEGLPLVVLHGFYLDSVSMIRAIEDTMIELKGFKRIYIDLPGMGQSPRHELDNNSDVMLDLLCEFIEEVTENHPLIVVGYSYGGYLAQGIAERLKEKTIGEVLICPVVEPNKSKRRVSKINFHEKDDEFFDSLSRIEQNELLQSMVVINRDTYSRTEADFSRAIALADNKFLQVLYRPQNYTCNYIEENKEIHPHKTLIFLGYQDNVVGYEDVLDKIYKYPKANVNLLANASHSFFLEQPRQFEFILNSFLSQYKN